LHGLGDPWKQCKIEFKVADRKTPSSYRICEEAFGVGDIGGGNSGEGTTDEDRAEEEEVRVITIGQQVDVTEDAMGVDAMESDEEDQIRRRWRKRWLARST
jgi:hypothetical protein